MKAAVNAPGRKIKYRKLRMTRVSTLVNAVNACESKPRTRKSLSCSGFSPQEGQKRVSSVVLHVGQAHVRGTDVTIVLFLVGSPSQSTSWDQT
jgi:hypothetical protein